MKTALIIIVLLLIATIIKILEFKTQNNNEDYTIEKIPYSKKFLLTTNEYIFYKKLKEVAEKKDCYVLAKIRLADLVTVNNEATKKEYNTYFSKIKSKHIDFALCNKENLYPEILIELQDNSHKNEDRIKRDEFLKKVADKVGYHLLFVYDINELENKILEIENALL